VWEPSGHSQLDILTCRVHVVSMGGGTFFKLWSQVQVKKSI